MTARRRTQLPCKVLMDIGGPKLRTGPMEPGPRVARFHPPRDLRGRAIGPARIWLTAAPRARPTGADAVLPVPKAWMPLLVPGASLHMRDLRGRNRELTVESVSATGVWATCFESAYLDDQTRLKLSGKRKMETVLRRLGPSLQRITVRKGEHFVLTRALTPGRPEVRNEQGDVVEMARIGCTLTEVFDCAIAGEPIWFDDGRIGGVIHEASPDALEIEVTQTRKEWQSLSSDKGINLPETRLSLGVLTPKDKADLPFVVRHADMVGLSFVRNTADVADSTRSWTGSARRPQDAFSRSKPSPVLTICRRFCWGRTVSAPSGSWWPAAIWRSKRATSASPSFRRRSFGSARLRTYPRFGRRRY